MAVIIDKKLVRKNEMNEECNVDPSVGIIFKNYSQKHLLIMK